MSPGNYYRIGVVSIDLPRLRDRRDDIPLLLAHFAAEAAARYHRPLPDWSAQQMAQWQAADWPGNVRELRNFAERLVLGIAVAAAPVLAPAPEAGGMPLSLPQQVDHRERELIVQALSAVDGNVGLAADNLMVPRKTLYDKLKKYQIVTGRK